MCASQSEIAIQSSDLIYSTKQSDSRGDFIIEMYRVKRVWIIRKSTVKLSYLGSNLFLT